MTVDEAAKQVIKVANNETSGMLEKATAEDIAGFQAFTIRNLDNKLSAVQSAQRERRRSR